MTIVANDSTTATTEVATSSRDETGTVNQIVSSEITTEPEASPAAESSDFACFPLGFYVVAPGLLATFGWFSRLTQDGCDYSRLVGPTVGTLFLLSNFQLCSAKKFKHKFCNLVTVILDQAELTDPSVPFLEVGFNQYRKPTKGDDGEWYISYTTGCEDYNTDAINIDGVWRFAKITGFLSLVLGGAGALFLWFSSCFRYSKTTWRWSGYELAFATIMQLLTYSWFGTNMCQGDGDRCALAYGSKADILTLILWFISAVLIFAKLPRKVTPQNNRESTTISVVELEMAHPSSDTQQHQPVGASADENRLDIPEIS